MDNGFPRMLAFSGKTWGFKVDRDGWTIDGLPVLGSAASVEVVDAGSRYTATRVATGVAAGALFWPAALIAITRKRTARLCVTVTAPDGRTATHEVPAGKNKHEMLIKFANDFNAIAATGERA